MVPCSRPRTMAAPDRMIASMVTLLMIPMTLVNQAVIMRDMMVLSPTSCATWVSTSGVTMKLPPQRENWSRLGSYDAFRHLAERLALPFIDVGLLIRRTAEIFEYPMCDRDPLPWWTQGRVTLLGDAAHPMYPVGSNGASQAILDARCLCDRLAALAVPEALAAYEAERLPATSSIVRSNRIGGPERAVDLVAARAPDGFARVQDVATEDELAGIVKGYAQLAGFGLTR
jgi:2-polyprenyl-6-methoxyphenol hydroxylase-like FAD-dependent oxidoreductase